MLARRFPVIEQLCNTLGAERLYDAVYRGTSAAVHTGLVTIDERIVREGEDVITGFRTGPGVNEHAATLETATVQFIVAPELLARVLEFDLETELVALIARPREVWPADS